MKADGKSDNDKRLMCFNCQQKGHISSKCPQPQRKRKCVDCQKVHSRNEPENCGKKSVGTRTTKSVNKTVIQGNQLEKVVSINDNTFTALIDTGSECSMIRQMAANCLKCVKEECTLKINGFCCGVVYVLTKIHVNMKIDSFERVVCLYVVDNELLQVDLLLGQDMLKSMRVTVVNGETTFENVCGEIVKKNEHKQLCVDKIKCGID
ncbi:uncharacterized protein LOC119675351 [Teleopsis dalmanni]|uniref:uncharacterized protein LOC119675351 n=1 Tax=Teleopsis dalmanni TaxID=139649 RepID=UPI0018CF1915|nr:uncharacterized protein LOC119675351 [Teleopsis dalmanni]